MKNQKGFSAVIVLLSILVITAIGFTGYYVFSKQRDTKETPVAAVAGAQEQAKAPAEQPTTPAQPENKDYLVIKEWSVKLPIASTISDATYDLSSGYAMLSKDTYNKQWDNCSGGGGSISRFKDANDPMFAEDISPAGAYEDLLSRSKKIGEYYYYFTSPQSMCGDPDNIDEWSQKSLDMMNAFKAAAANLQAAN